MRRLAESGAKGPYEVGLREVGDPSQGGDIQRLRVGAVHRIAGAEQTAVGTLDSTAHSSIITQSRIFPRLCSPGAE